METTSSVLVSSVVVDTTKNFVPLFYSFIVFSQTPKEGKIILIIIIIIKVISKNKYKYKFSKKKKSKNLKNFFLQQTFIARKQYICTQSHLYCPSKSDTK